MAETPEEADKSIVEYASKSSNDRRDPLWIKGLFAVLGVIAALLIWLFLTLLSESLSRHGGPTPETKETATIVQISNLKTLLQSFNDDNGRFPAQAEGLDALVHQPPGLPNWHPQADEVPMDSWGQPFIYRFPGKKNPESYDLISVGPDGKEGTADDITQ